MAQIIATAPPVKRRPFERYTVTPGPVSELSRAALIHPHRDPPSNFE